MNSRRSILVLCPFPEGVAAGQRLKYEQYFEDWRAHGFDIHVSPYMDMDMWNAAYVPKRYAAKGRGVLLGEARRLRDLVSVDQYDLTYVFMNVSPIGTTLFERVVRERAKRLIFDLEDNVLVGQQLDTKSSPNPLARFLKNPNKARYLVETSDHVITSSPFLNDDCVGINRHRACTYISSSVDTDRFVPAERYTNESTVTIGWTGTFSSRPYLDLLRNVFLELSHRVRFRLRVIGNFEWSLPGVDVEVIQWTKEREVADLQGIDIGVYPLPTDDWVLGKSGLKAIQYMAFGIPTVATNVGTTPRIIRDGENGLLVRSDAEWVDALERLVLDADLQRRLGTQARADAVAHYSVRAIASQYRSVIYQTLGDDL